MGVDVDHSLSPFSRISELVLNALRDQICLIDQRGTILFVNEYWVQFAESNGGSLSSCGVGVNYLHMCQEEPAVYEGLSAILAGEEDYFTFTYPCHSPFVKRWFLMQATPLKGIEQEFMGAVIRHVDITKQKILKNQLKEQAEKDALTSLYNRRYFNDQLRIEYSNSRNLDMPLSILYIDIDNFKEINDTYGHSTGDLVLKELSLLIRSGIREVDTPARIGGDEFAVLVPGAHIGELTTVAQRLIEQIRMLKVEGDEGKVDIAVSIGGKSFSDTVPIESMLQSVDEALYVAKNSGKNQVVIG